MTAKPAAGALRKDETQSSIFGSTAKLLPDGLERSDVIAVKETSSCWTLLCCGSSSYSYMHKIASRILAPTPRMYLTVDRIAYGMQGRSRRLRRRHFDETADGVKRDDLGWWFLAVIPKPIEEFQRNEIYSALLTHTVLKDPSTFADILRTRVFNAAPAWMVWEPLTDRAFEDIFSARFGSEMLRKPTAEEEKQYLALFPTTGKRKLGNSTRTVTAEAHTTGGMANLRRAIDTVEAGNAAQKHQIAVVDMVKFFEGAERKTDMYPMPGCKLFFSTNQDIRIRAIVLYHPDGTQTNFIREDSEHWHFAKRAAAGALIFAHQIGVHLVHGHLMAEAMVVQAYKYLPSSEHFLFKWFEPLAADVGFINESWGTEVILYGTIMDMGPFTSAGLAKIIENAKTIAFEGDLTWNLMERLKGSNCGVSEDCRFNYRTTARVVSDAVTELATAVVDRYLDPNDNDLKAFMANCYFWRPSQTNCFGAPRVEQTPAQFKESVKRFMVEFYMNTSFRHDYAHDDFLWRIARSLPPMLLKDPDPDRPETYLPSKLIYAMTLQVAHALQAGVIETPLEGFYTVYGEDEQVKPAIDTFVNRIKELLAVGLAGGEYSTHGHMNQCGSMTH